MINGASGEDSGPRKYLGRYRINSPRANRRYRMEHSNFLPLSHLPTSGTVLHYITCSLQISQNPIVGVDSRKYPIERHSLSKSSDRFLLYGVVSPQQVSALPHLGTPYYYPQPRLFHQIRTNQFCKVAAFSFSCHIDSDLRVLLAGVVVSNSVLFHKGEKASPRAMLLRIRQIKADLG